MGRRTAGLLLTSTVALAVVVAMLSPASAGKHMPAKLHAFTNITGHSYSHKYHHAGGKLRLHNASGHHMSLDCLVTITWSRDNGDIAKRSDHLSAAVGAGNVRTVHFHARFHDPPHLFNNIPTNAVPHCREA